MLLDGARYGAAAETTPDVGAAEMLAPASDTITKGLAFLAESQADDGSFGGPAAAMGMGRNPAIVGLSGMAFLGSGSTPGRGPYGRNIDACVQFLLDNMQESGFISPADGAFARPDVRPRFRHALPGRVLWHESARRPAGPTRERGEPDRRLPESRRGLAVRTPAE